MQSAVDLFNQKGMDINYHYMRHQKNVNTKALLLLGQQQFYSVIYSSPLMLLMTIFLERCAVVKSDIEMYRQVLNQHSGLQQD